MPTTEQTALRSALILLQNPSVIAKLQTTPPQREQHEEGHLQGVWRDAAMRREHKGEQSLMFVSRLLCRQNAGSLHMVYWKSNSLLEVSLPTRPPGGQLLKSSASACVIEIAHGQDAGRRGDFSRASQWELEKSTGFDLKGAVV